MKNILFAMSLCMFVAALRSAENGVFKSRQVQVLELIELKLKEPNPKMFSHKDLMNIGLVCKNWDGILCESALDRKMYVLEAHSLTAVNLSYFYSLGNTKWHRYGSMADYKKIDAANTITRKELVFGRLELGKQGMVKRYFREGSNFDSELSYKPSPFYKSETELCCFGLAWIQSLGVGFRKRLVLYSAPLTGHINPLLTNLPLECSLRYESENEQHHESLIKLLNFSHLLKSIVNMPYDYFWNGYEYGYRFDLEKMILPDSYKECVKSDEENCYKAFAELPEKLRAAFEKRYKEQQKPEQKTEK